MMLAARMPVSMQPNFVCRKLAALLRKISCKRAPESRTRSACPGGGLEDALLRQAVAALGRGHHDGRADAQLLPGLLQPLAQQIVPALVGGRIFQQQSYAQGRGLAGRSRQDGGETKNGQQDGQAQQPGDIKAFFHVRLPAAY